MGCAVCQTNHNGKYQRTHDAHDRRNVQFKDNLRQTALVFSVMIGLAATWTKAVTVTKLLDEFQKIVLEIVQKIVIPILPIYIAFTFCSLAYE